MFVSSLVGIAGIAPLKASPSYNAYHASPYYERYIKGEWPEEAKSVLVLALAHDPSEPGLDWWRNDLPGRTRGNFELADIAKQMKRWLWEEHKINAYPLPYYVEKGGVFLKHAATLAGLGTIGKNNLLVTPEFRPRIRLRAVFLNKDLSPTGPIEFAPCEGCDMPCRQACP